MSQVRSETLTNVDLTAAWWYIENKVLCLQDCGNGCTIEDDEVAMFRKHHTEQVAALLANIISGATYADRYNDVVEVLCLLHYDMHGDNTPISPATITATLYGLVYDLVHEQWKNEINLFNVVNIDVLSFNRVQNRLMLYVLVSQEI